MNIKNNNIAAGIDIGSNSVRLLIASVEENKIKEIIYQEKATTRLASNITTTGILADGPFNKTIKVLMNFKKQIEKYKVEKVVAVATSAIREAKNGIDFVNAAKNVGVNISIITGNEEGELEYLGVTAGLSNIENPLIIDVGGGSTEIIHLNNNKSVVAESYKIGVVKLADMFDFVNTTTENIEPCANYISDIFKDVYIPDNISNFIVTAGTATTIAAISQGMIEYDWTKINGHKIAIDEFKNLLHKISTTPYNERINIKGMDKGREDLIIPGSLVILDILKRTKCTELIVSDFGLREGAVVRAANSN